MQNQRHVVYTLNQQAEFVDSVEMDPSHTPSGELVLVPETLVLLDCRSSSEGQRGVQSLP